MADDGSGIERPVGQREGRAGADPRATGSAWSMGRIARGTLVVLLVTGLAMLVVPLANVILLVLGAIVVATIFRAAAAPLQRVGLPETAAVLVAVLAILLLLGGFFYLFGREIAGQFEAFSQNFSFALAWLQRQLANLPGGADLTSATPAMGRIAGGVMNVAFGTFGVLSNAVLILIGAMYFALDPQLYVTGVSRLFPQASNQRVRDAMTAAGRSLRLFIMGQLVTMTVLGTAVAIGLLLLGVPSAIALALILAIANIVPVVGPFIGAVPGILIALTVSPELALWTTLLYFVLQQLEGNVLTPMVQNKATSIPPALLVVLLAAFSTLFGIAGALLAGPLSVMLYTLVAMLWTRDSLGYDVKIPGNPDA